MRQMISNFLGTPENLNFLIYCVGVLLAVVIGLAIYAWYLYKKPNDIWEHKRDSFVNDCKDMGKEIAILLIRIAMLSANKNSALELGMIKKEINDQVDNFPNKLPGIIGKIKDWGQLHLSDDEYSNLLINVGFAIRTEIAFDKFSDLYDAFEVAVDADKSRKGMAESVHFLEIRLAELKSKE